MDTRHFTEEAVYKLLVELNAQGTLNTRPIPQPDPDVHNTLTASIAVSFFLNKMPEAQNFPREVRNWIETTDKDIVTFHIYNAWMRVHSKKKA